MLLAPVFCSDAGYRLLLLGARQLIGRKHPFLELLLLLAFYFPLGTLAEAVGARMFLSFRKGQRPAFAQTGEIVRAPGLVPLLARLIGLLICWMVLALTLACVLLLFGFLLKAFAFGMVHHGARMPRFRGWSFAYVMTFALLDGALVSRYSFVLPMFAGECRGSGELFKRAVERARPNLVPLSLINVLEYGLIIGIGHGLRRFEGGWPLRAFVVIVLSVLITSATTTWFAMLKTDLAFSNAAAG